MAHWQVAAFRLPLAQNEALGCWDAPPGFSRFHPMDFPVPHWCLQPEGFQGHEAGEDPGAANLWWRVRSPNRHTLQIGMGTSKVHAPPMPLSRDNIFEASFLKPIEENGPLPTPEDETALLGKETKSSQVPGSPPELLEIFRFVEPAEWSTAPSASSPSPMPQPNCLPSGKVKKSQQGMKADPNSPGRWVCLYLQEHDRVPEGWREFWYLHHSKDKC